MDAVLQRDADIALSDREMDRIVRLVYERSGITLHQGKRALIVARLHRLLKAGGFTSFSQYVRHVETDLSGHQLSVLLDAITTNHTSFFREDEHFRFLADRVVPPLVAEGRPVRLWCAACSTGQEPVSIAMTLMQALPESHHGRVRLLASDISTRALKTAGAGVYPMKVAAGVPPSLLKTYFERGLGADEGKVRVRAQLRRAIEYRRVNLIEIENLNETFDVVFCRNVMIYFDKAVQQRVVSMIERHLAPGGYLFIAHSESLNGLSHELKWMAPAVYQRRGA
ncbi:MAG TPA: CheR family methyltransferase [Gemmatimonadaceae bacterium]|nr:CheR family methyltransferase [Gemmatimonadaceae bacterium]